MNLIRRMFPELLKIRLRNSAEFYTLFMLIWEMDRTGFVLVDKKRNRMAFEVLKSLSVGVDELRERLRKARPAKAGQKTFSDYLLTVQGDTDSLANRERRHTIIKGLVWSIFEKKDAKRGFTPEQRRLLWHREENPKCARCGKALTWNDVTIDHLKAWSKGGESSLRNAQLMHRLCNIKKGAA